MIQVAWIPGWYELDPPLEVGLSDEFAFWRIVPDDLRGPESLVLYNTLWRAEDAVKARGTILSIYHPVLGAITRVETDGLDYTLTLADGTELLVDAEEEPGKLFERVGGAWSESNRIIDDWRFVIEFETLSQPKPAA